MRDIAKKFLETNETTINTKEIKGTDVFEIDLMCATPLAQISPNGGQSKRYFYDDNSFSQEPFYTSNGFRGFLRRVAFMDLVEHIKGFEDYKPKGEETYLYTSGNGGDKKSISMVTNWEKEQKVRKASPLLSLFGAGLGNIAGKVAIDELTIPKIENKFIEGKRANGEPYKMSKFLGKNGETRADSLLNDDIQMIIDSEDAQRVSQAIRAEAETAKKAKKEGVETDAKQQNAQMIFDVEYLIAGTPLKTAINPIAKPTDLNRPGHVFPLIARPKGVMERRGHTEGSIDIVKLAGLGNEAVLCELTNVDGTMAKVPQIIDFAEKHEMTVLTIEDIYEYRLQLEEKKHLEFA